MAEDDGYLYAVKVKAPDMNRWEFLTPDGTLTTRRVHAGGDTKERAEAVASRLAAANPEVQFKAARLCGGK